MFYSHKYKVLLFFNFFNSRVNVELTITLFIIYTKNQPRAAIFGIARSEKEPGIGPISIIVLEMNRKFNDQ